MNRPADDTSDTPTPVEPQVLLERALSAPLNGDEAFQLFTAVVDGNFSDDELTSLLVALHNRGEQPSDVEAAARALLRVAGDFPRPDYPFVDNAGTGGDQAGTINISSAAALVAAAAGAKVIKHGNRAVSSRSGSADVLAELGIPFPADGAQARSIVDTSGFTFLLAPVFHPVMGRFQPIRKALGTPTIFNLLGPLLNPARPARQIVGVGKAHQLGLVAGALHRLGREHALVVHGSGLDEISVSGPTQIVEIRGDQMREFTLTPAELGLDEYPVEQLAGGTPEENAQTLLAIFSGQGDDHPAARAAIAANAGALFYLVGMDETLADGTRRALETIDSGDVATFLRNITAGQVPLEDADAEGEIDRAEGADSADPVAETESAPCGCGCESGKPGEPTESEAPASAQCAEPAVPTPEASRRGYFGRYGGQYVSELLLPALDQLDVAFQEAMDDPAFVSEFNDLLTHYLGRPTPITPLVHIPSEGARIVLKREDLVHGGAHKGNQVVGQALLAKRLGKTKIIAETGAGQHGTATAMVCARLGLECVIYMGAKDVERQAANVYRMRLMGATVEPVDEGTGTLKDAVNKALRTWSECYDDTHYLLGTAAGPHPFPTIVREFHRMIGAEAREQMLATYGRLPSEVVACVGGGSNAIGIFADFIPDADVALVGAEPAGHGLHTGEHGAAICRGKRGWLHGAHSYVMNDDEGQVEDSYSISAGLDYPAVGPEHAYLADTGRARYVGITDREALDAFARLSAREGIIPALESAHALAYAYKRAPELSPEDVILVNLSGRGDKDIPQVQALEIQP